MNPSRTGLRAKGTSRIQLDFNYAGTRYRPTISAAPTESNLQHARSKLKHVKVRIANGTFSFAAEFPNYRSRESPGALLQHANVQRRIRCIPRALCSTTRETRSRVCNPRELSPRDRLHLAPGDRRTTLRSRDVLDAGQDCGREARRQEDLQQPRERTAARLRARLSRPSGAPQSARGLKTLRIRKKDRPPVDPFSIEEAEALVAAIHQDWGEAQGNYDEFRFFTGTRPSEQIALLVSDFDLERGTVAITKARVMARDKDRTKTSEDRTVQLCPRALEVLKRQLALRERRQRLGTRIDHEHVFFKDDDEPIRQLHRGN